jgi:hypothetical protein
MGSRVQGTALLSDSGYRMCDTCSRCAASHSLAPSNPSCVMLRKVDQAVLCRLYSTMGSAVQQQLGACSVKLSTPVSSVVVHQAAHTSVKLHTPGFARAVHHGLHHVAHWPCAGSFSPGKFSALIDYWPHTCRPAVAERQSSQRIALLLFCCCTVAVQAWWWLLAGRV